jgi:hypothetical protein
MCDVEGCELVDEKSHFLRECETGKKGGNNENTVIYLRTNMMYSTYTNEKLTIEKNRG